MIGFLKKKENRLAILEYQNIRLDCSSAPKADVINQVGSMLVASGYVGQNYIDAMHQRELSFPTNIGNGIALPHGVEAAKKEIYQSGIAIMVFPEGTLWGEELVKLVIGIAGVGEEHLQILSTIAEQMSDPEAVTQITRCTQQEIYQMFTKIRS